MSTGTQKCFTMPNIFSFEDAIMRLKLNPIPKFNDTYRSIKGSIGLLQEVESKTI